MSVWESLSGARRGHELRAWPAMNMSRRALLRWGVVAGLSPAALLHNATTGGLGRRSDGSAGLWADDASLRLASRLVEGKSDLLKVLEHDPIVLETPLDVLAKQRITPNDLLFVRNNQDLNAARGLASLPVEGWTVRITGLDGEPRSVTVAQLQTLPQVERELVLQCSGNSRFRFAESVAVPGTPWGAGGMGNVRMSGVRLRDVLSFLKAEPAASTRYLTANGRDVPKPKKDDFEHSLPVNDALELSFLALTLNGEPLPAIHGGPVRLITPGYFATMHIKWLDQLQFAAEESTNDSHGNRYRVSNRPIAPGMAFKFTRENSRPNYQMNIKSVVLLGEKPRFAAGKPVLIPGVAFNDGQCPLEAVFVSLDQGQTWKPAELSRPESRFAWTPWQINATLPAGQHEIWSRAVDRWGRTQPLDGSVVWNPNGYEWNGVDRRVLEVV